MSEAPVPAPEEPARSCPPERFLAIAAAAAADAGVTRLAEITGLDRLGLPVWQAVRPAGRALSLHQGKGASALAARIGALCEAIESHAAESAPADGPFCAAQDLPPALRPDHPDDFAADRAAFPASGPVRWCEAEDLETGARALLPHDLVSLDFTGDERSPFERSSNGLGAGASFDDAAAVGLAERIERDAVGEWRRAGTLARMEALVDLDTVPFAWFGQWRRRLESAGASVKVAAPEAAIPVPVFLCSIGGPAEYGGARAFLGSGAHGDPEIALFRAFAEAVQSRLTWIAGARDDLLPSHYRHPRRGSGALPPLPPGFPLRHWEDFAPGPVGWPELAEALARSGYRRIAVRRLREDGVCVVKTFVPGLGTKRRTRRRP